MPLRLGQVLRLMLLGYRASTAALQVRDTQTTLQHTLTAPPRPPLQRYGAGLLRLLAPSSR